jgi:hypothetical protein
MAETLRDCFSRFRQWVRVHLVAFRVHFQELTES